MVVPFSYEWKKVLNEFVYFHTCEVKTSLVIYLYSDELKPQLIKL